MTSSSKLTPQSEGKEIVKIRFPFFYGYWTILSIENRSWKKWFFWESASLYHELFVLNLNENLVSFSKTGNGDRYWLGVVNSITDSDVISLDGATESFCLEETRTCFVWWLMATMYMREKVELDARNHVWEGFRLSP